MTPDPQELRARRRAMLERLRRDGAFLAERFRLPLRSIDPESRRVRSRYGVCFDDGTIKIRLHNLRTGELLKYSFLVDTLCHELAHLRHFNHGPHFQLLYQRILGYARRNGVYRPMPRVSRPPRAVVGAASSEGLRPPRRDLDPLQGSRAGEPARPRRPVQLELF